MKKLVLISALFLFVASYSFAGTVSVKEKAHSAQTDDHKKKKEATDEKKEKKSEKKKDCSEKKASSGCDK